MSKEDIVQLRDRFSVRNTERRMQAGVEGLIEEINDRDPSLHLKLDMKQYAAVEGGRIVQWLREEACMTQRQLADVLNVKQQRISYIEQGKSKSGIQFSTILEVARACKVELTLGWKSKKDRDARVVPLVGPHGRSDNNGTEARFG